VSSVANITTPISANFLASCRELNNSMCSSIYSVHQKALQEFRMISPYVSLPVSYSAGINVIFFFTRYRSQVCSTYVCFVYQKLVSVLARAYET
jgi:hypothetical protein